MSASSKELQVTGAILALLGFIGLIGRDFLTTISNIFRIEIESLIMIAFFGLIFGIVLFIVGVVSSRKKPTE